MNWGKNTKIIEHSKQMGVQGCFLERQRNGLVVKTTCLPFHHSVLAMQMKTGNHCVGSSFAMDKMTGPVCFRMKFLSTNCSPSTDFPPVPSWPTKSHLAHKFLEWLCESRNLSNQILSLQCSEHEGFLLSLELYLQTVRRRGSPKSHHQWQCQRTRWGSPLLGTGSSRAARPGLHRFIRSLREWKAFKVRWTWVWIPALPPY